MFRLWDPGIINALTNAAINRKVSVQVLVDDGNVKNSELDQAYRTMKERLKATSNSRAMECEDACHGDGQMHNKFLLVEDVKKTDAVPASSYVVVTGTSNMSFDTIGGTGGYNSAFTQAANQDLFLRYSQYFADLTRDEDDLNYYDSRPPATYGNVKAYFYPRDDGADPVLNTLREVTCSPLLPTHIRIQMWSMSRTGMADELAKLGREGCRIEIVANHMSRVNVGGDGATRAGVCPRLAGQPNVSIRGYNNERGVHDKNLMIDGYYMEKRTKAVWTGSQNYNYTSKNSNDENYVRILGDEEIHDQYADHMSRTMAKAPFAVSAPAECVRIEPKDLNPAEPE